MVELDDKCPFCNSEAEKRGLQKDDGYEFACTKCGRFGTLRSTLDLIGDYIETGWLIRSKVAVYLREQIIHYGERRPLPLIVQQRHIDLSVEGFRTITWEEIVENRFPIRVSDRCDRALGNLAKLSRVLGEEIDLFEDDYPILFALSPNEMRFMAKILKASGLVTRTSTKTSLSVGLSAAGWDRVTDLEESGRLAGCKQAFVAMNFDPKLNSIWDLGVRQAIVEAGFTPIRIDREEHNEYIPDKIIAEIRRSRFLVADMTGQKHGVYFEAGFALGLGIPVIWTSRNDEIDQCHFDTKQISHILWDDAEDLRVKLVNRIRATIV